MRTRGTSKERRAGPQAISARLNRHVVLEADSSGKIAACFDGYSVGLDTFSANAVRRAQDLRSGLPLASFTSARRAVDGEIDLLVRRLARHGLLEYRVGDTRTGADRVVIEPQVPDYWPRPPRLRDSDVLVLSRFAYMRRRGNETVLESPRSGALFRIGDANVAATIAMLSAPRSIRQLRRRPGFPGLALLALLLDCQIVFKTTAVGDKSGRAAEGDDGLVLWDFHDLLFHARSTEGRHANPVGGVYPHAGAISPLPAVRPRWPGRKIDLRKIADAPSKDRHPVATLLRERRSIRGFDEHRPIALAEVACFLDGVAPVLSKWKGIADEGHAGAAVEYAVRPYPSAGASYELELYLAVDKCVGLTRGFYHYDAGAHALVPIGAGAHEFEALLAGARYAMGEPVTPQVLITIAARFGRVAWKYSSIAYALILKDAGVLTQTLYLMATGMGLGGCAIGSANIELFARMTGVEFHVEGPVGQFALGRSATPGAPG
jgi:SagB-type dehydrogenase family enzyme